MEAYGELMLDRSAMLSKKIVVSDMDGTLTDIKCDLERDMSEVIGRLLKYKALAVIGGGTYGQFQKQFVAHLECPEALLSRVYLFPTCATAFYAYKDGEWRNVYLERLSSEEKRRILAAFDVALRKAGYVKPETTYGDMIEDRETQVTFSALGQRAPPELKKLWDPDHEKRKLIRRYLEKEIPEFEINIGGGTSIDVTRKGIDKAYGIRKIMEYLKFSREDLLFVGDALFEGGNDYPVKSTGVDCVSVSGPHETMRLFSEIAEACGDGLTR